MTTAYEHLEKLLDSKNVEIAELTARVSELEDELENETAWTRHREFKTDPSPSLPVPRLEIRWTFDDDERAQVAVYSLVYKHLCDQIVFVPLGKTRRTGVGAAPRSSSGEIDLPFRDGAHIRHDMDTTKLPGFAVLVEEPGEGKRIEEAQRLEGRADYMARMRAERDRERSS